MNTQELRDKVKKSVTKGGAISHTTGRGVILFPFTTSKKEITSGVWNEISVKDSFLAAVMRQLCEKELSKTVQSSEVEEHIVEMVDTKSPKDLKHIVRYVAFDSSGNLLPFCENALLYIEGSDKTRVEKLATHFFGLYLNDTYEYLKNMIDKKSDDIFHRLLLDSLPDLDKKKPIVEKQHYPVSKQLRTCFDIDLKNLCSGEKFRVQDLKKLFIYYLFAHQIEVALRFQRVLYGKQGEDIPLYTMEWEQISASREGYIGGWKRIEHCRKQLFSMAICSELMNWTSIADDNGPFGYSELVQLYETLDQESKNRLEKELDTICDEYKSNINDVTWDEFIPSQSLGIVGRLKTLHEMVEYQFSRSTRQSAANRYNDWLLLFANINFLKSRGRIGRTLTLTREWFLFLASLCAQSNGGRIRLNDFWEELRKRGIGLDHDSKLSAVSLLDRLGLLDKKSDSGDAQYVRSVI